MIPIVDAIAIHEDQITFQAVRSSGPGGQHVNKVSTAIVLKYPIEFNDYPGWFVQQLKSNAGSQISKEGVITIRAQSHRSQARNKEDALNRLIELFKKSAVKPKHRKKTKPPRRAKESRLLQKKRQSEKKNLRKPPKLDD
tara:strand:+ start:85 stop:504 length:420 start_codon:yes stop_codon:yes gene_type:complete